MSVDDFFAYPKRSALARRDVFVNRDAERGELGHWAVASAGRRFGLQGIQSRKHPASNLRVLLGGGGLGKSALAREFVEGFTSDGEVTRVAVTIDFEDRANDNFETVLLRLRAALGTLGGRWPAFDVAFAAYWATTHPGQRLEKFLKQAKFLRPAEREQLWSQSFSVIGSVLGSYGTVGAAYQAVRLTRERLLLSSVTKTLIAEVPAFERICLGAASGEDVLGYFAALLAYDLECHRIDREIQVLCVLDTFEVVQDRVRGGVEDLVSRLVYLMPNVAFLIGTRRHLRWADDNQRLVFVLGGQHNWPTLNDESVYLDVEKLEIKYAREYLETVLVRANRPVIPLEIRELIVKDADGWPLYLDLSVDLYRMLLERDRTPQTSDFGGPMTRLVQRIMRDMSRAERDILRAACVLTSFSDDSIRAALPSTRGKVVANFLKRTFVKGDESRWPNHWIHDKLREAILDSDTELDDGWTPDEWRERALNVAAYLENEALAMWSTASDTAEFELRSQHAVAAAILLVELGSKFNVEPKRLGEVMFTASQLGYATTLRALPEVPAAHPSLRALVETARSAADNSVAKQRFQAISIQLKAVKNAEYERYIRFELGPAAQDSEQYDKAVELFASLSSGDDPMSQIAAIAHAGALLRRGELASALRFEPTNMPSHPLYEAVVADMRGHIRLQGGDWEEAAGLFEQAFTSAQECDASLWAARARRHVAKARMWFDPQLTRETAEDALELNMAIGDSIGIAQCHMALAVSEAYLGNWKTAFDSLALAKSPGVSPLAVGHTGMVETLFHLALGDSAAAHRATIGVLRSFHDRDGRPPVWCAVTAMWAGREDLAKFDNVEWYDSADLARARWMRPLQTLRAH